MVAIVSADTRPKSALPADRQELKGVFDGRWSRRRFGKIAVGAGLAVGTGVLGVFKDARMASADGYDIYWDCPSYASGHKCSPGCGPSAVCGSCCTSNGWHRHSSSHTSRYKLRPNKCVGGWADGWVWTYQAACASCARIQMRCHDGYYRRTIRTSWQKKICRYEWCV